MSYTAPVVDASGQTFANLQARGLDKFTQALVAALSTNAATAAETTLVNQLLLKGQADKVAERARDVVDSYLSGKPASIAALKAEVFDLQLAYASIAGALGEIGVLIDANQGTLAYTSATTGIGMSKQTRTF